MPGGSNLTVLRQIYLVMTILQITYGCSIWYVYAPGWKGTYQQNAINTGQDPTRGSQDYIRRVLYNVSAGTRYGAAPSPYEPTTREAHRSSDEHLHGLTEPKLR